MHTAEIKKRVNELLSLVGLESAAENVHRNYSGGMKKRLDLSHGSNPQAKTTCSSMSQPLGLILNREQPFGAYLEKLNKEEDITIFLTTQYLEEADKLCRGWQLLI